MGAVGALFLAAAAAAAASAASPTVVCGTIPGAEVGQTYLVTMAATNATDRSFIVSTFASAVVVNVTSAADSKVCASWDGLDDNLMPVVPGSYGVKAIATKAAVWGVDGQHHSITPSYAASAMLFPPDPRNISAGEFFWADGDTLGSSMGGVGVDSLTNSAVFTHHYLENAHNNFLLDLASPIAHAQCRNRYPSGGHAGGWMSTTDGSEVWSVSANGAHPAPGDASNGPRSYLYKAGGGWGLGEGCSMWFRPVVCPAGAIVAVDHTRIVAAGSRAGGANCTTNQQCHAPTGGSCQKHNGCGLSPSHPSCTCRCAAGYGGPDCADRNTTVVVYAQAKFEGAAGSADAVFFLDGAAASAPELASVPLAAPLSIAVSGDFVYALHANNRTVSRLRLDNGLPAAGAAFVKLFEVAEATLPNPVRYWTTLGAGTMATGARGGGGGGALYVSDTASNVVVKLDGTTGKLLHTFGSSAAEQRSGTYDATLLMGPTSLSVWGNATADGDDHILVVESRGPNRIGEWASNGAAMRVSAAHSSSTSTAPYLVITTPPLWSPQVRWFGRGPARRGRRTPGTPSTRSRRPRRTACRRAPTAGSTRLGASRAGKRAEWRGPTPARA